jgi:DNA polymerase-1
MNKLYKDILSSVENDHSQNIQKKKNSRVLVVDGLNTFIRCWSSIPTMNDDGDHVAGVTGTLKSIGFAIKQVQPTRVIVVFDGSGGSQSRKKIYPGYKANRDGKNKLRVNRSYDDMMNEEAERESMKRQIAWLGDLLHELPVTTMMYDKVEADDVMAYIATHLLKEDEQAVLMSTDKDFLQLVNEKTIVWSPTKKKIYNKKLVKEEFGIESKNLLLYRMLDGDVSDNIPGIKGCGIKTLVKRFPELTGNETLTVDDLLELAKTKQDNRLGDKLKPIKILDDIIKAKPQILLNNQLMQLTEPMLSGTTKMNILTKFDEELKPLKKLSFFQACVKYKVMGGFGRDINTWLKATFETLITD